MADLIESIVSEGEQAIDSFAQHAVRLTAILDKQFPKVTLETIAAEFAKTPSSPELNPKVAKLGSLVREESAVATSSLRAAEMWLRMKEPAVSDGNNFGVDVQNYVIEQIRNMRLAIGAFADAGRDYHWGRAEGLRKLFGDEKSDSAEGVTVEQDAEKKTEKKTTSKKTLKEKSLCTADYNEYVISLDVQQYYRSYNAIVDMRNAYLRAHQLFSKNMKRLSDPRGEGSDGSSRNVMSMF